MIEREATIVNQEGLHARPAAKIVRLASSFDSEIELFKDGLAVNGEAGNAMLEKKVRERVKLLCEKFPIYGDLA